MNSSRSRIFRLARFRRIVPLQLRWNSTKAGNERQVRTPRELYEHLSQYIVGQERAKRILSVAVFNHYQRIRSRAPAGEPSPGYPPTPSKSIEIPIAGPSTLPPFRRDSPPPHVPSPRQPDPARPGTSLSDGSKKERIRNPPLETDASPEVTAKWAREGYFDSQPPPPPLADTSRRREDDDRLNRTLSSSSNIAFDEMRGREKPMRTLLDVPRDTEEKTPRHPDGVEIEKSNVLVIGPTGTGKTLMTRTLAKILDVPFATCDATTYTSAGYVGEDVENCILRLLQASEYDVGRAEVGIIHIDEVDKLSRRGAGDGFATWGGGRDVGGEGVQQAFLRLLEGTSVTLSAKPPPTSSSGSGSGASKAEEPVWDPNNPMNRSFGSASSGKKGVREGLPGFGGGGAGGKGETFVVDTTNILFICSGAFVGLETIVNSRLGKGSIGFGAPLPTPPPDRSSSSYSPDPEPLKGIATPDLTSYGLIPEFLGRLPILSTLHPLSIPDLVRILTEPRNSLVKQYMSIFTSYSSELRFTRKALEAIAKEGLARGGGARGLRGVLEEVLADAMFEVPGSSVRYCLISESVVKKDEPAMYFSRGQRYGFERRCEEEDGPLSEEVEEGYEEEERLRAAG